MAATNAKNWNLSIQLGRLIAACFVVFIHVMFPTALGGIAEATARFAVPFFFAVSGYFSYQLSAAKILKRAFRLFRLTIIATLICLAADLILVKFSAAGSYEEYFTSCFSAASIRDWILFGTNPISEHLWYLSAALGCYVLFAAYSARAVKIHGYKPLYRIGILLLLSQFLLGSILPLFGIRFSYQIYRNTLLLGLPMFILGLYIREHQNALVEKKHFHTDKLILYIGIGTVCSVIWRILFYETELPIGAVIAAGAFMLLTASYPHPFNTGAYQHRICDACSRISLVIYIIHPTVNHILSTAINLSPYLQPFIVIATSMLCGIIFDCIMSALSIFSRT